MGIVSVKTYQQWLRDQVAGKSPRPSRSSIRRVLVDEGILPDPGRHAPKGVVTPWRTFVAAHVSTMVACDFFCKPHDSW